MISFSDLLNAPEVIVKPIIHRGLPVVGIFVKTIPLVRFSKTFTCWYVPYSDDLLTTVNQVFEGKALVNDEALTANRPEWKEISSFTPRRTSREVCPPEYIDLLVRKRYSDATVKTYISQFEQFLNHFTSLSLDNLGDEHIRKYMHYLIEDKKVSGSTQNQAINAIKFYYEKVKGEASKHYALERPIKESKLPMVLSEAEVIALFGET